jgi:hypothetical protein
VVQLTGFEPVTYSLEGCCSNPTELKLYMKEEPIRRYFYQGTGRVVSLGYIIRGHTFVMTV